MIVGTVFVLLVLLLSVLAVRAYQNAQDRKRAEAVRSALAVCFEENANTEENTGGAAEEELPAGEEAPQTLGGAHQPAARTRRYARDFRRLQNHGCR